MKVRCPGLCKVSMRMCMDVWIKWLARSTVRPDEIRRETHVAPPAVSVRRTETDRKTVREDRQQDPIHCEENRMQKTFGDSDELRGVFSSDICTFGRARAARRRR